MIAHMHHLFVNVVFITMKIKKKTMKGMCHYVELWMPLCTYLCGVCEDNIDIDIILILVRNKVLY